MATVINAQRHLAMCRTMPVGGIAEMRGIDPEVAFGVWYRRNRDVLH